MLKLLLQALGTFVGGALLLGLLLFGAAGSFDYWQAWAFILVFNTSVMGIGLYLSLKDPELLERRKKFGPTEEVNPVQKIIMSLALVVDLALVVLPALGHRLRWPSLPAAVCWAGDALLVLGFVITYFVFKQNSYGASTIRIEADQQVISTGLYGLVRHPMYVGVLVMVTGVPLALGSAWVLTLLALIVPGLMWRILDEEKLLKRDLPGYNDYTHKVKYRLFPYLW